MAGLVLCHLLAFSWEYVKRLVFYSSYSRQSQTPIHLIFRRSGAMHTLLETLISVAAGPVAAAVVAALSALAVFVADVAVVGNLAFDPG